MAEEIDWVKQEHANTLTAWLLLETMSKLSTDLEKDFPKANGTFDEILTVELTINGRPVPVVATLNEIEAQLEELVKKKALELMNEKFNKTHNALYELERFVANELEQPYDE